MSMHPKFQAFNFQKWVDENADQLKPPVGNKLVHTNSDMIVMVVGGPNTRVDFHDDPADEWFHQIKGDMMIKIADGDGIHDVIVREGDVFMLPSHTLHAPQRPQEGSIGIVVEGARHSGMVEGFEWFCFACETRVHRVEIALDGADGIVSELPKIFETFAKDEEARTCPECSTLHPGKGPAPEGWVVL
jgi:3-hydroxyanthranilate 3,4-dioxygenase